MDTDPEPGTIEAWLAALPLEALADAWWRYTMRWDAANERGEETPTMDRDPDGWAEQVWQSGLLLRSETTVRNFLRIGADRAPQESPSDYEPLGYLGAGPIEDFVSADLDRLLWIETMAKESRPFREALRTTQGWPTEPQMVKLGPGTFGRVPLEVDPLVAEAVERIQSLP